MIKTGVVISIMNKKAGIMTHSGEFVYIRIGKTLPKIGEINRGELYVKNLFNYKHIITAASLMFVILSSSFAYAYYSPVTTIVLSINPDISLKANRWNKIISIKALNLDGSTLISNIKLKNKSIDEGLELLVKEAKVENFINDEYVNGKKIISVDIKGNKDNSIDISNFISIIDSNNFNIIINTSSNNNKKIDITVDNKKIDSSTLNLNSNKKESTNKNEDAAKDPLKNPSVDINTNNIDNKPSKNKNKDTNINKNDKPDNKNPNSSSSVIKKSITSNEIKSDLKTDKIKNVKYLKIINNDNNSVNHSIEIGKKQCR